MAERKIPMRMCSVTREKYPKKELLRIVKFDNKVFVDPTGKANGKGAYLKKDRDVVEKARKTNALSRIFEMDVNPEIYDEILKNID